MPGGTLLISRAVNWFPQFKERLEAFGFPDVHVTAVEKDGLNMLIDELNPDYVLIDSNFYDCGTPYMVGQMLGVFPKLNIAVINTGTFPDAIAAWFVFHGVKFYVKWLDGKEEFHHGLQCFLEGKRYIAPDLQNILDGMEWPVIPLKATKRQKEILLMLCCGWAIKRIEDRLHVGKSTVESQITELMKIFNSRGRAELIMTVNKLEIFTKDELSFYDDGDDYSGTLPEWAITQKQINKIAGNR